MIVCVSIPYFKTYAHVKHKNLPLDKPYILLDSSSLPLRVSDLSSFAARCGVEVSMLHKKAESLCFQAGFIQSEQNILEKEQKDLFEIIYRYSPKVEKSDYGLFYFELDPAIQEDKQSDFCLKLIRTILSELKLKACVSIASTKFLANLALHKIKSGQCLLIKKNKEAEYLGDISVQYLNLSNRDLNKMYKLGIYKIKDLFRLTHKELYLQFSQEGERIYKLIRGQIFNPLKISHPNIILEKEKYFSTWVWDLSFLTSEIKSELLVFNSLLKERHQLTAKISIQIIFDQGAPLYFDMSFSKANRDMKTWIRQLEDQLLNMRLYHPVVAFKVKIPKTLSEFSKQESLMDFLKSSTKLRSIHQSIHRLNKKKLKVYNFDWDNEDHILPEKRSHLTLVDDNYETKKTLKPIPIRVLSKENIPKKFDLKGRSYFIKKILRSWIFEDEWWLEKPIQRQYFLLLLLEGQISSIFFDRCDQEWFYTKYSI
ncbi:MAG: hypothetical protein KC646_02370 [Candidatus Cloacimonetes bacterium]|nr:hypothetical protein [Candidatus Cloacimonadota bacterium]